MSVVLDRQYTGRLVTEESYSGLIGRRGPDGEIYPVFYRSVEVWGSKLNGGDWYLIGNSSTDEEKLGGLIGPYTYEAICTFIRFLPVSFR